IARDHRRAGRFAFAPALHDELIGGERQLTDPFRRVVWGRAEQRLLALLHFLQRHRCGLRSAWRCTERQRHCLARHHTCAESAGAEEIFVGVETSLGFNAMKKVPVPVWRSVELTLIDAESIGLGAAERDDAASAGLG